MDIMTLSATSIEGYDYTLIITDDASMYRCQLSDGHMG
jgi:hypothetical protein